MKLTVLVDNKEVDEKALEYYKEHKKKKQVEQTKDGTDSNEGGGGNA